MVQYESLPLPRPMQLGVETFPTSPSHSDDVPRPAVGFVMRMRFTLIDSTGAISFTGPGHGLKMLAAACSLGVRSSRDVIERLESFDQSFATAIRNGLSSFDEHCIKGQPETVRKWVERQGAISDETFRVLDDETRRASLEPGRLGLVIFNIEDRRIVQVQNSYGALMRSDRGRIRKDNRPTSLFYRYELPREWAIVP